MGQRSGMSLDRRVRPSGDVLDHLDELVGGISLPAGELDQPLSLCMTAPRSGVPATVMPRRPTRSPRVIRDPRLQHNRPSVVEPHRSHFLPSHPRRAVAQPALRPTPLYTTQQPRTAPPPPRKHCHPGWECSPSLLRGCVAFPPNCDQMSLWAGRVARRRSTRRGEVRPRLPARGCVVAVGPPSYVCPCTEAIRPSSPG